MPVTSASAVSARMFKVADATRKAQAAAVKEATLVVQASIRSSSPSGLRNASKSGGKLSTQVKITGGPAASGFVKALGPWPLIEFDTPVHLIGIGRGARRRARVRVDGGVARGGYLKAAGYKHGVTGPIVHPGTHGKHPFRKGAERGTPKATAVLAKANINAVKEAFS